MKISFSKLGKVEVGKTNVCEAAPDFTAALNLEHPFIAEAIRRHKEGHNTYALCGAALAAMAAAFDVLDGNSRKTALLTASGFLEDFAKKMPTIKWPDGSETNNIGDEVEQMLKGALGRLPARRRR